ncbi:hypothetical protein CAAR111675_02190 [Campylobacter armoricus]
MRIIQKETKSNISLKFFLNLCFLNKTFFKIEMETEN